MTLKEKLEVEIMDLPIIDEVVEDIAKNLEYVADDFAIGFAEWLRENYYDNGELWTEWNSDDNTHSSKELLEIYKKETGL